MKAICKEVYQNSRFNNSKVIKLIFDSFSTIKRTRERVAKHGDTPIGILIKLSKDKSPYVRDEVAQNFNTPSHILENLYKNNPTDDMLLFLSENPKTPSYILEELSTSDNEYVAATVAGNQSTPIHILEELSRNKDSDIRMSVAQNESTPIEILIKLSKDKNKTVCHWASVNESYIKYKEENGSI